MAEKKAGEALLPLTHYRANRERASYLSRSATAANATYEQEEDFYYTVTTVGESIFNSPDWIVAE